MKNPMWYETRLLRAHAGLAALALLTQLSATLRPLAWIPVTICAVLGGLLCLRVRRHPVSTPTASFWRFVCAALLMTAIDVLNGALNPFPAVDDVSGLLDVLAGS